MNRSGFPSARGLPSPAARLAVARAAAPAVRLAVALALALVLAAAGTAAAAAAGPDEAMAKAGCLACHAKDKKMLGPSFKDIAAKYRGQDVTAKLIDKVRKGGSGVFGAIPMAPNGRDKIGDDELKAAIEAILKS